MNTVNNNNSNLIPAGASIPPIVGEYCYYDSRINKDECGSLLGKQNIKSYCIETTDKETRWCHYSLRNKYNRAYITCGGVIANIK